MKVIKKILKKNGHPDPSRSMENGRNKIIKIIVKIIVKIIMKNIQI